MSPELSSELYNAVYFIDANEGWAVGTHKTIIHTTNGGNTWTSDIVAPEGASDASWQGVYILNSNEGWASGYAGIFHTDNGKNWYQQYTTKMNSVFAVNSETVWAVGEYGVIIKSENGGDSWSINYTAPGVREFTDIFFYNNGQYGWAVGQRTSADLGGAKVFHTSDGGNSWQEQTVPDDVKENGLIRVRFVDQNVGWVVGQNYIILHTTDGGANWVKQTVPSFPAPNPRLYGLHFYDANTGWATGQPDGSGYGVILHTTDGGATWKKQAAPTKETILCGVFFIDNKKGWIATQKGGILHTTTGGEPR